MPVFPNAQSHLQPNWSPWSTDLGDQDRAFRVAQHRRSGAHL